MRARFGTAITVGGVLAALGFPANQLGSVIWSIALWSAALAAFLVILPWRSLLPRAPEQVLPTKDEITFTVQLDDKDRAFLAVTNHGPAADFRAQAVSIDGIVETLAVPWTIPWREGSDETRTIGRGETRLLRIAIGNGMGTQNARESHWEAGEFDLFISSHAGRVGPYLRTHLAGLQRSEDICRHEVSLTAAVAVSAVAGNAQPLVLTKTVHLGFENRNNPQTGNLAIRARLD